MNPLKFNSSHPEIRNEDLEQIQFFDISKRKFHPALSGLLPPEISGFKSSNLQYASSDKIVDFVLRTDPFCLQIKDDKYTLHTAFNSPFHKIATLKNAQKGDLQNCSALTGMICFHEINQNDQYLYDLSTRATEPFTLLSGKVSPGSGNKVDSDSIKFVENLFTGSAGKNNSIFPGTDPANPESGLNIIKKYRKLSAERLNIGPKEEAEVNSTFGKDLFEGVVQSLNESVELEKEAYERDITRLGFKSDSNNYKKLVSSKETELNHRSLININEWNTAINKVFPSAYRREESKDN